MQVVVAGIPMQDVVAGVTVQRVVAGAAAQSVVAVAGFVPARSGIRSADDGARRGRAVNANFAAAGDVDDRQIAVFFAHGIPDVVRETNRIAGSRIERMHHVHVAGRHVRALEHEGVVAGAAVQRIAAGAADQLIVTVVAAQDVVAAAALQTVVAVAAVQGVVAAVAAVPPVAEQGVVTGAAA